MRDARCASDVCHVIAQGLEAGVYWYRPNAHDVQRLRDWPSAREALAGDAACAQPWLAAAPAALVVAAAEGRTAAKYGAERGRRYALMEAGCAVQNALLQVEALGLGAAWVGAFHDEGVTAALGLPPQLRPLAVVPFGRRAPQDAPHSGERQHADAMRAALTGAAGEAPGAQRVAVRDTSHDID
jgi:SagB-type dehydrogenase family enzyme